MAIIGLVGGDLLIGVVGPVNEVSVLALVIRDAQPAIAGAKSLRQAPANSGPGSLACNRVIELLSKGENLSVQHGAHLGYVLNGPIAMYDLSSFIVLRALILFRSTVSAFAGFAGLGGASAVHDQTAAWRRSLWGLHLTWLTPLPACGLGEALPS